MLSSERIEYVCDAHPTRDATGPLVTRVDDSSAYCAGHGGGDHRWRRIEPKTRAAIEAPARAHER